MRGARRAALAAAVIVLALVPSSSASAATTGSITRATANADWKTGSLAGSVTSDFCTTYPGGCSSTGELRFWFAFAVLKQITKSCTVSNGPPPPLGEESVVWDTYDQTTNGTVSFDLPNVALLASQTQHLCLYWEYDDYPCDFTGFPCMATASERFLLADKQLTVQTLPPPTQTCPPTCPPPPCPPTCPDKVTSFSALKVAGTQKLTTLKVRAGMDEPGTISVAGTVSMPNASKVYKLKAVKVSAFVGATMTIKVKLPKKALKAAKRALRRHRKVKANLTITARDKLGNVKVEKRSIKLKA
jgi:hypothetical protein